jgi:formylglycine-generating enzyme required for sulfatase activity
MVTVAGGTMTMGSPDGIGAPQEHPQHAVTIKTFELDRDLVTVRAYDDCVRAGACSTPGTEQRGAPDSAEQRAFCNGGHEDRADHPITCVDFRQASSYCAWAGKRLPTEAEWEYAAKSPGGREYPWGETPPSDQLCWKRLGADDYAHAGGTCAVGAYPSGNSAFGAHDMVGNVWVWTSTPFTPAYDKPADPIAHAVRGGGWRDANPSEFRGANRNGSDDTDRVVNLGFRCAR